MTFCSLHIPRSHHPRDDFRGVKACHPIVPLLSRKRVAASKDCWVRGAQLASPDNEAPDGSLFVTSESTEILVMFQRQLCLSLVGKDSYEVMRELGSEEGGEVGVPPAVFRFDMSRWKWVEVEVRPYRWHQLSIRGSGESGPPRFKRTPPRRSFSPHSSTVKPCCRHEDILNRQTVSLCL